MEIASKILKQAPVKWKSLKWLQNSNLKDIPADALSKLKKSLTENDFIQPFNVWQDSKGVVWILDGHHREKALKELETEGVAIPEELPANFIDCKTKKDAAKLVLVYSSIYARVSDQGLFDFLNDFELKIEDLTDIDLPTIDLNAWEQKHFPKADESTLDEVPAVQTEVHSETGDIFVLDGKHRVMCGDSTKESDVSILMNGDKADMVFTDPPYGVAYTGGQFYSGKPSPNRRDEIQNDRNLIYEESISNIVAHSKGGAFYIFYSSRFTLEVLQQLKSANLEQRSIIVWEKLKTGYGDLNSHYKTNYEPLFYGVIKGKGANWVGDTAQTTTWKFDKPKHNDLHPTMKPIELIIKAIHNSSKSEDVIVDPFLGSGSTLIAAEQTNRICYGMEIDPQYIDVILRRYKKTYPNAKIECETRNFPFDALFSEEK